MKDCKDMMAERLILQSGAEFQLLEKINNGTKESIKNLNYFHLSAIQVTEYVLID